MNPILKLYFETGALSHAYLLTGEVELAKQIATEIASELLTIAATETSAHPDFFYQKVEILGIKDSQEIKRKASIKPSLGEKKVFIIETLAITIEAENALLKIIEEPPSGTHFFVIVPTVETLIPTLRSRFSIFEASREKKIEIKNEDLINSFISAAPKKRLDLIQVFFEKDKPEVIDLLNELGFILEGKKSFKAVEEIERVKKFLYNPTGSQKMILEHLALTLPRL
jgi:DNA polymerase III delta prime subunit